MRTPLHKKSAIAEIKERFDRDVERFSNIETGQQAVIDAPLMLELISRLAIRIKPDAENILDIGCGAGNNTIMLLREKPGLNCDLSDLSGPMLERARDRVSREGAGDIRTFEGDFREAALPYGHYDIIVAAATLHHLRDDDDWIGCFEKIYSLLRPRGVFLISDMVHHEHGAVQDEMWNRYGIYLESLGGKDYRNKVFEYIDLEDSPRSVTFQMELMKKTGFNTVDIIHKNSCFAAFYGVK